MNRQRGLFRLVQDRLHKHGLYDTPAYWDGKATQYEGLARSNWPSNTYNEHVHRQQMAALDDLLGDVAGLDIADVGCGTGRASLHLATRGARVHGFDFSPRSLAAARAEAQTTGLAIDFVEHDVKLPVESMYRGRFDVVLSLGCLTLACRTRSDFEAALDGLTAMLRPGGRLLFIEPVHRSRLLARILRMSLREWIGYCEIRGYRLEARRGILFVPTRYALAFRDLPARVTDPVFAWGEVVLEATHLERLADYKVLLFRARG